MLGLSYSQISQFAIPPALGLFELARADGVFNDTLNLFGKIVVRNFTSSDIRGLLVGEPVGSVFKTYGDLFRFQTTG